jgi:cellulose synthase/poly-beta-1,6-N-acetylglucosamine synthase-like glycosyltransferase
MAQIVFATLATFSVVLSAQSAYTLYMMIYTWEQPEAERLARAPERFAPPRLSFTVMLPARHEEDVIQQTIENVARANYPPELLQVFVICRTDDQGTIDEALIKMEQLQDEGLDIVDVVAFDDTPINKPHGMNHALQFADRDVVTIFDAEDDVHPEIFNIVNTVMVSEGVKVVQAGVQLMNYQSRWYSTLNVLEYFFWFKSRLHYHAKFGSIPLGGNTVFFGRDVLLRLGGWDETNLTEDADMGLRISQMGERVRVIYDDRYVTREETPPTLTHFIKQRTRWSQGFMQTLGKGTWKHMPTKPPPPARDATQSTPTDPSPEGTRDGNDTARHADHRGSVTRTGRRSHRPGRHAHRDRWPGGRRLLDEGLVPAVRARDALLHGGRARGRVRLPRRHRR